MAAGWRGTGVAAHIAIAVVLMLIRIASADDDGSSSGSSSSIRYDPEVRTISMMMQDDDANRTSEVHVYSPPDAATAPEGSLPGVVFGHGLCASATHYAPLLGKLASEGNVVLATNAQSQCDAATFQEGGVDTQAFRDELVANVRYMAERMPEVNASKISLVGHSMVRRVCAFARACVRASERTRLPHPSPLLVLTTGALDRSIHPRTHAQGGGAAINAAAILEEAGDHPIASVVAIAPWNGVTPRPTDTLAAQSEPLGYPLLLLCAPNDTLVPCSGHVTAELLLMDGAVRVPFLAAVPSMADDHGPDWRGGVLAIYQAAAADRGDRGGGGGGGDGTKAGVVALAAVRGVNHLTIVGEEAAAAVYDRLESEQRGMFAMDFGPTMEPQERMREGLGVVPTAEWVARWIDAAANGDGGGGGEGEEGAAVGVLEQLGGDQRFVQPVMVNRA